jgi:hypothetical protein
MEPWEAAGACQLVPGLLPLVQLGHAPPATEKIVLFVEARLMLKVALVAPEAQPEFPIAATPLNRAAPMTYESTVELKLT